MPKHTQRFNKPADSYVHPSLSPSSTTTSVTEEDAPPQSVNERLRQLRLSQTPKPSASQKQAMIDVATCRSVPPSLQSLLSIPDTAPPRPRLGSRMTPSRTPGPAAPRSWGASNGSGERLLLVDRTKQLASQRQNGLGRPRPLKPSPISPFYDSLKKRSEKKSLSHYALKVMAQNWDSLIQTEQYNLATLPVQMKSLLLSYICIWGPDFVDINTLRVLFLTEAEVEDGTGSEEVTWLDLSGLLNSNLTVRKFKSYYLYRDLSERPSAFPVLSGRDKRFQNNEMKQEEPNAAESPVEKSVEKSVEESIAKKASKNKAKYIEQPPLDSWEDDLVRETRDLLAPINSSRFPNLTRLCLSHPGPFVSWADLLSMSPYLATLTHLSLAYWPTPSLTPNSVTSAVISPHGPSIRYGGTDFYSAFDNDWAEAANILRRLSNNTYCLKWLDLEGCAEWIRAIAWPMSHIEPIPTWHDVAPEADHWIGKASAEGSANSYRTSVSWETSWKQVEYVNVSQNNILEDVATLTKFPLNDESFQRYTKELERCLGSSPSDFYSETELIDAFKSVQERDKRQWRNRRSDAEEVEFSIRKRRMRAGLPSCKFYHGWYPSSNQLKWMDRLAAGGLPGAEDFMFWMSGRME